MADRAVGVLQDYYRCTNAKGEDFPACKQVRAAVSLLGRGTRMADALGRVLQFWKNYHSLCPSASCLSFGGGAEGAELTLLATSRRRMGAFRFSANDRSRIWGTPS